MALILNGTTGVTTTEGTTPFADGTIGTAQIAADAITTPKIAAGAVVEADIADGAVTTNKLSNSGVTAGTYTTTTLTVDAKGRITSASSGSGGGVTSLNGQTGAITNTGYNTIGSYVFVAGTNTGGLDVTRGSAYSGSSLLIADVRLSPSPAGTIINTPSSNISGTWRMMGGGGGFDQGPNESFVLTGGALFVRVS